MDERPDIVMVMTDQHAARIMGCAGDGIAETPNLDRLASQGTRFENCYCPSPLCVPSRMAFLSGLEPHRSGVLTNDDYLASDIPTIAHALGAAGYDCRLVGRMHFYGPDQLHGFGARPVGDIGASFPGAPPPDIGPLTKGRGNRGPELEHSGAGETSYQAYDQAVAEQAIETLHALAGQRQRSGRPFFLLVSFFCPHPPYIARRADYDVFDGRVPPPSLGAPETDHPAIAAWREAGGINAVSAQATHRSRTAYYGLVRMIDRLCGRLFDAIDTLGLDNAVTIYASDHGECVGERGLWWKSVMYDQSAKVPLVIRAPDMPLDMVDRRVTNLIDLSATILGWAEAPALPQHAGRDLRKSAGWNNETYSAYYGGLMNISLPPLRHRMVRTDRYKLIWFDGDEPMLFDLEADPLEQDDLADDPSCAATVSALERKVLEGWDPAEIATRQDLNRARARVIRQWVRATRPQEPARWLDPHPGRNRYE
ncbi:sulfatase-like hydrolase/transferase [Chelativorans sp. M5D2P16]|uniref:sulfatase-like hydrolase/transferase n=1 Tax=Chelativorans sp. M5D2P16 TaxID=3095678 RepID=UPI002ACA74BC|nr:sulfatase-like hydrolase/transferase [Chelativorans sp. M5D2P16]MDZ5699682.1 sulfatase-like hydrolase/transferase [Chelativorans sp. M5D2P16]